MTEVLKLGDRGNVRDLEYDPVNEADGLSSRLVATFSSGQRYSYSGVPQGIWDQLKLEHLRDGGEPGKAFVRLVRNGGFSYAKLEDGDPDLEPPPLLHQTPERRFVKRERPAAAERQPAPAKRARRSAEERRRTRHS